MKAYGLTKWFLMELHRHLLMSWFMDIMLSCHDLSSKDYNDLMMDELEDLHMIRLRALENIEKNKMRVANYYNKRVKVKQFAE
jgi:hypothetical protein